MAKPFGHPARRRRGVPILLTAALLAFSNTPASFRIFDDFEDEALGPIGGQDGWVSSGGDNAAAADPAGTGNQVLYVPSSSSILRKSLLLEDLAIPNGARRMAFFRLRVGNKQTFSVGVSGLTYPSEYSDFAPEIGMANSVPSLDLRAWDDATGNYVVLTQLLADRWYNVWILVDALSDAYQVWLHDRPGAAATTADGLYGTGGIGTFEFRSGANSDLINFYVKTSGGGSGTNFGPVYFDDIYLETADVANLENPLAPATGTPVPIVASDDDKATIHWEGALWATTYDVVRGELVPLRAAGGEFVSAAILCLASSTAGTSVQDQDLPAPGEGLFYLVRGRTAEGAAGTYDSNGPGLVATRDPGIQASAGACP